MDEPQGDFGKWFRELYDFEVGEIKTYYGGTLANPAPVTPTPDEDGWIVLGPTEGEPPSS